VVEVAICRSAPPFTTPIEVEVAEYSVQPVWLEVWVAVVAVMPPLQEVWVKV
jgi:hypothetical protein